MAEYNRFIGNYERIPYNSFVWKFGTTSFRTREFNRMTEWQLQLLDDFWKKPENKNQGWEKKYMAPGQKDIYEIKNRYYDWLVKNGFTKGDDKVKSVLDGRVDVVGNGGYFWSSSVNVYLAWFGYFKYDDYGVYDRSRYIGVGVRGVVSQ